MIEIILVRHGQTDGNKNNVYYGWHDFGLNEEGKKQANLLRHKLKDEQIDAIYASPLRRALETVALINDSFKMPVKMLDELKEMNFGDWEGLSYDTVSTRFPELWKAWCDDWIHFTIPGGESASDVYERNVHGINAILDQHRHGKILIISHHGCIRNMISYLLGGGIENHWRYRIKPGGICRIQMVDQYGVLNALNE